MAFIFFGTKKAVIGMDELIIRCPSCEKDSYADVMISSNYYHIYFIPIFPVDKEADCICQDCRLKTYAIPFNERTFKNYREIKSNFRHPWYTYVVSGLFTVLVLLVILFNL